MFNFWNLHQISSLFRKKKIAIANAFPKSRTVKDLVRPLSKKRRFRTSFDIQHVKGSQHSRGSQTVVKSVSEYFYHVFPSLCAEMIWNISPLLKFEMIGMFLNTLTADDKYGVPDCENLRFPIQMQFS